MAEEMKKVELSDIELDDVAGGAFVEGQPTTYRCGLCCKQFTVTTRQEIRDHLLVCPSNPNNFR